MSFLLDALGKADDDRRRAIVPELRASRYQRRSPWRRVLHIVLILVAVLVAFILGYVARPYIERGGDAAPPVTEVSGSISTRPEAPAPSPALPDASTDPAMTSAPSAVGETPVLAPRLPEPALSRPEPSGLGAVELSVISYSSQPAARFVMLDGVVMYEGDMLDEDVRLVLIKPNGVVLERNGQTFSINLGGSR